MTDEIIGAETIGAQFEVIDSKPTDESGLKFCGIIMNVPYFPWPVHRFCLFTDVQVFESAIENLAGANMKKGDEDTDNLEFEEFYDADEEEKKNYLPMGMCDVQSRAVFIYINLPAHRVEDMPDSAVSAALMNTLSHECLHAVFKILAAADADELNLDDSNEHATYMMGTLMEAYYNMLAVISNNPKDANDDNSEHGTTKGS